MLAERGESHRITEPGIAKEIWLDIVHNPKLHERQAKVASGRFLQSIANTIQFLPQWTPTNQVVDLRYRVGPG